MKVHKIEIMVLDFEDLGSDEIARIIEENKYMHASAMSRSYTEIEWSDDHPLNKSGTMARAFYDLFAK